MMRIALIASVSASLLAACSTAVPPAPEVVRQDAAPRPTLTSVMVEGVAVRTLADEVSALDLARAASDEAAGAFEGDNKGNACYEAPRLQGVAGGQLSDGNSRREEFWTYTVCGETYEVPVIVTKQSSGAVAFTVKSGREAR